MVKYSHLKTERKWQRAWTTKKLHQTRDSGEGNNFMLLTEFPYPSGNLHIGHWYTFAVSDILARHLRMSGKNVMYPIGFDAFGLPAENAAIKNNTSPEDWTKKNIAFMSKQLSSMGAMFDWSRAVSTIDPEYYRWTQWMFLQFYKKGLAYRAKTKVNWCPKDKTVLANEQVSDGRCERCDSEVVQKDLEQWMYKITAYADQLTDGIDGMDWPHTTKAAQQNWIGRSRGALIKFPLRGVPGQEDGKHSVEVFTTRPDTIFGATFVVVSPELAQKWIDVGWQASDEVRKYVKQALGKRELERQEQKDKTGVPAGMRAVNPLSGDEIPVWVADYVLGSYGTGAIMAVPAHDERDKEFAGKFNLPVKEIELENSEEIIHKLEQKKSGSAKTTYRLRDWILSRQRYWGCPIPMVKCSACGYQPVPEEDLPVKLPKLKDFHPTDDGRSPLAKAEKWVKVKCPQCGKPAERETDTMDTFVDSSWYFMRYTDPKNKDKFADPEKMKRWLPVSMYVGGAEHNTMHLLYSRFFAKALKDLGFVDFSEPFTARRNHGTILGPDGQKMSKSRGNVVDPDELVAKYGADVVRLHLAFMAPYDQGGPWDPKGINGSARFIQRVWKLFGKTTDNKQTTTDGNGNLNRKLHIAIKKIGEDIQEMHYNTAVSELMKLLNEFEGIGQLSAVSCQLFLKLLAPFAPHIAEEIWTKVLGNTKSVHLEPWPAYKPELLKEELINIPVQVNGKVKAVLQVRPDISESDIVSLAMKEPKVELAIGGGAVQKTIYIPGKMLSIVFK